MTNITHTRLIKADFLKKEQNIRKFQITFLNLITATTKQKSMKWHLPRLALKILDNAGLSSQKKQLLVFTLTHCMLIIDKEFKEICELLSLVVNTRCKVSDDIKIE